MAEKLFVIRPSMMASWANCSLQSAVTSFKWEFLNRGFDLNDTPRGIAAAIGNAGHASVKCMMKEKLQKGTLGDVSNAIEYGINYFEQECQKGEIETDEITPSRAVGKDQIARIAKVYAQAVGYKTNPKLVEHRLEAKHPTAQGWKFSGAMDLVTTENDCPDLKTGKPGNYGMQLGAYSLILKAQSIQTRSLSVVNIQRPLKGQPDPVAAITTYDERILFKDKMVRLAELQAYNQSLRIIRDFEAFLKSGSTLDIPQNPNSFLCSAKFCPAWGTGTCDSWKK